MMENTLDLSRMEEVFQGQGAGHEVGVNFDNSKQQIIKTLTAIFSRVSNGYSSVLVGELVQSLQLELQLSRDNAEELLKLLGQEPGCRIGLADFTSSVIGWWCEITKDGLETKHRIDFTSVVPDYGVQELEHRLTVERSRYLQLLEEQADLEERLRCSGLSEESYRREAERAMVEQRREALRCQDLEEKSDGLEKKCQELVGQLQVAMDDTRKVMAKKETKKVHSGVSSDKQVCDENSQVEAQRRLEDIILCLEEERSRSSRLAKEITGLKRLQDETKEVYIHPPAFELPTLSTDSFSQTDLFSAELSLLKAAMCEDTEDTDEARKKLHPLGKKGNLQEEVLMKIVPGEELSPFCDKEGRSQEEAPSEFMETVEMMAPRSIWSLASLKWLVVTVLMILTAFTFCGAVRVNHVLHYPGTWMLLHTMGLPLPQPTVFAIYIENPRPHIC